MSFDFSGVSFTDFLQNGKRFFTGIDEVAIVEVDEEIVKRV